MMNVREEQVEEPNPRAATDWDAPTLGFTIYHFDLGEGRGLRARWPMDRSPLHVVLEDDRGAEAPYGWFYELPEAEAVIDELRRRGFQEIRILAKKTESLFDPTCLKAAQ